MLMSKYAVISVGKNNYGHPSKQTLSRLEQADEKEVYRTDEHGDIVIEVASNGKDLIIN